MKSRVRAGWGFSIWGGVCRLLFCDLECDILLVAYYRFCLSISLSPILCSYFVTLNLHGQLLYFFFWGAGPLEFGAPHPRNWLGLILFLGVKFTVFLGATLANIAIGIWVSLAAIFSGDSLLKYI
jgi:hypothetical protein